MRKNILFLVLFIVFGLYYSNPFLKESFTLFHSLTTGLPIVDTDQKELWIEVHDVSPSYARELEEVVKILDEHHGAYSKVVLFVIPNHGGSTPLRKYPEFTKRLRALEKKGFIIGLHGYTHEHPLAKPEFKTRIEHAEMLLHEGEEEFSAAGMKFPRYFLPPGWQTSREVDELLRNRFEYVYYYYYIDSPEGIIPSQSREYVWYGYSFRAFEKAQKDYTSLRGVIRLTIHLGAINNKEGLNFLDSYLGWIEEKSNISGA
jgi:hypothetical protein